MAIKIIELDDGGICLKGSDCFSFEDIYQANLSLYATPENIKKIKYQLCDYTDVKSVQISSDEIHIIAKQDICAAKVNPDMLIAVVGSDDLVYGLSRMWESFSNKSAFEVACFRTLEEAKEWIAHKIS